MKVTFKAVVDGGMVRYDDGQAEEPCCKEMSSAFGIFITFGNYDFPASGVASVCIETKQYGAEDDYTPISFCPFCGQRIECVETKRVRLVKTPKTVTSTTYETREEEIGPERPAV